MTTIFDLSTAIRIALAYGLNVFTTVSTLQKRKFILSLFPQLKGLFVVFLLLFHHSNEHFNLNDQT